MMMLSLQTKSNSDDNVDSIPQDQNPLKYVQWLGKRNIETGMDAITHTHAHICAHKHTFVCAHVHTHTHTHTHVLKNGLLSF